MGMVGGRVQPLHVIERDGRIDQEAEQPGADQIPEQDGREEHERPMIVSAPTRPHAQPCGAYRPQSRRPAAARLQAPRPSPRPRSPRSAFR